MEWTRNVGYEYDYEYDIFHTNKSWKATIWKTENIGQDRLVGSNRLSAEAQDCIVTLALWGLFGSLLA